MTKRPLTDLDVLYRLEQALKQAYGAFDKVHEALIWGAATKNDLVAVIDRCQRAEQAYLDKQHQINEYEIERVHSAGDRDIGLELRCKAALQYLREQLKTCKK